jgi:hypothetical protein
MDPMNQYQFYLDAEGMVQVILSEIPLPPTCYLICTISLPLIQISETIQLLQAACDTQLVALNDKANKIEEARRLEEMFKNHSAKDIN